MNDNTFDKNILYLIFTHLNIDDNMKLRSVSKYWKKNGI